MDTAKKYLPHAACVLAGLAGGVALVAFTGFGASAATYLRGLVKPGAPAAK